MLRICVISWVLLWLALDCIGQCHDYRYNTSESSNWMTCGFTQSPNPDIGLSKWVQYDLGSPLLIGESWIWNINSPDQLGRGVNELEVYYSLDGNQYTMLGSYSIGQGNGSAYYEGEDGPDFAGIAARYILLTLVSNHEGTGCIGLGEVTFETLGIPSSAQEIVSEDLLLFPNPSSQSITILTGQDDLSYDYQILNTVSASILSGKFSSGDEIDISVLPQGMYYFHFRTSTQVFLQKFSVIRE